MGHLVLVLRLFLVLAAALLQSNCSSGQLSANNLAGANEKASAQSIDSDGGPAAGSADSAGEPTTGSAVATSNVVSPDYRISPRDILDITVFQVPDLTRSAQVGDDGNISLPLIGRVTLRDKTTHEAEETIAGMLRKKYLQSPQVSVFVKQYGQRVTVSGEVKIPKVLSVDGRVTLSQAIANAGGLSDLADPNRVHVARTVNQRIKDEVYDLEAIQAGKIADPVVQGGDLIVAEQSGVRVTIKNVKDLLPFAILTSLL